MAANPQEVSKILHKLGEKGLKASDEFYDEAIGLAHNVFETLRKNAKRFSVAQVRYSGSIGKKTDVIDPDLDLVVVVNNFRPPMKHKEVLEEFEDILILNERKLRIMEGSIVQKTAFSVQFAFYNGIEVDLLPAPDLEPREVYKLIADNPKSYYNYNICLVSKQVAFVKSQSSFAHCLIRLLKYWGKSLVGVGKLSGRSFIMEVVGVASTIEEEDNFDAPDILRAFSRAINWFCTLKTMKLAFKEVAENQKWVRVPMSDLTGRGTEIERFIVPKIVGTMEIFKRGYFIIDPANPFNDLLGCQKPSKLDKFVQYAGVTKKRLDDLMSGRGNYFKLTRYGLELDILKLFQSQPWQSSLEFPVKIPSDFQIGYSYPCSSLCCDLKVRNETAYKDLGVQNCLYSIKWNLLCAVKSAIHGRPGKTAEEQKKDLWENVQNVIKTSFKTELATTNEDRHNKMDVTLTVPYQVGNQAYAVKASFTW